MTWTPSVLTFLGMGAGAISTIVAGYALAHRDDRTTTSFALMMMIFAVWSVDYAIQLGFSTPSEQVFLQGLTLGVAGVFPTAWLVFAFQYSGYVPEVSRRWLAVLLVEPVAFLVISITNPVHGLVFRVTGLASTGYGSVVSIEFATAYAIHAVYAYGLVVAGIVILAYVGVVASPMYRNQALLLVAGILPPFLSHVGYTLGVSPVTNLDLTPFLSAITGIIFGLGLIRYDLVDRRPVARQFALESVHNGLITVDEDGRIVEVNAVAREAFDPPPQKGQSAATLFDAEPTDALDGTFHQVRSAGERRVFLLRVSNLGDHTDRSRGTVIALQDVTDLRAYEQRLEVSNRVLRHNLRTATNVIRGYAGRIVSHVDDPDVVEEADRIQETADDLYGLSEKARDLVDESTAGDAERVPVDLVGRTEAAVSTMADDHPATEWRIDAPETAVVQLPSEGHFSNAIRNLLENAVEHNDADEPEVAVRIRSRDSRARVQVVDNGPGISDLERRVFEAGSETPLQHSQGIGLWIAYLHTTEAGGEFDIEGSDEGTTVTMSFRT
jgi:signal transduction histidine kinase